MTSFGKYIDLWTKKRSAILEMIANAEEIQSMQLSNEEFKLVGKRADYSFNLEILNGSVSNNIDGSAVARDLAKVLERSNEVNSQLNKGHYKFRMDRNFCLWVSKL